MNNLATLSSAAILRNRIRLPRLPSIRFSLNLADCLNRYAAALNMVYVEPLSAGTRAVQAIAETDSEAGRDPRW